MKLYLYISVQNISANFNARQFAHDDATPSTYNINQQHKEYLIPDI